MDDSGNPTPPPSASTAAAAAAQHQQLQRQFFLMQQAQAQAQAQPHPQQLSQQAMSRFPSNIDAHLRPLGSLRFHQPQPQQPHSQGPSPPPSQSQPSPQQQQQAQAAAAAAAQAQAQAQARVRSPEVEMALQDAMRVCNPDIKTPFQSIEDAVNSYGRIACHFICLCPGIYQSLILYLVSVIQIAAGVCSYGEGCIVPNFDNCKMLLPYHVVADYEAEEDDRILDSDTTGQIPSRLQQWDHNILVKIAEFTTTFEKQVLAYNIMTKKRAIGEFRSEERLMLEQALLQEEKLATMELRAEMEREKAGREAAEAKMRMAMAEHARAEAQAHSEMITQGPIRANAAASQGDDGPSHGMVPEQGEDGWGNAQRDDEDPSEDFLNDENEPENGNSDGQDDYRRSGEFDLNSR
ncbi:hypothetical protein ACP70R_032745 [Stipagrostis hirtigluma subsp. patula]